MKMKKNKRILSLILCLCLLFAFSAPAAYAESGAQKERAAVLRIPFDLKSLIKAFFERLNLSLAEQKQNGSGNAADSGEHKEENKEERKEEEKKEEIEEIEKIEEIEEAGVARSKVEEVEREVARLVNLERAKYGLKALTYSQALADGAREKSEDMQRLRYFSHTSPTYGSPFDQMKKRGITYRAAGENIAMGYASAESVVEAWMNSPGHRANILNEKYTEIGVGYVENGNYFTQWFRG